MDFGSKKEKQLYQKLARTHDVSFYLGITVNIQFRNPTGEYETRGELDFLSNKKVFFWANDGWTLPTRTLKMIQRHGYTVETDFEKLSKREKAKLGVD